MIQSSGLIRYANDLSLASGNADVVPNLRRRVASRSTAAAVGIAPRFLNPKGRGGASHFQRENLYDEHDNDPAFFGG